MPFALPFENLENRMLHVTSPADWPWSQAPLASAASGVKGATIQDDAPDGEERIMERHVRKMRTFGKALAVAVILSSTPTVPAATASAAHPAKIRTLGQYAHAPRATRRGFAYSFLTRHYADPCNHGRHLSPRAARNILPPVIDLRPGRDRADGSYLRPSLGIGRAIAHLLANIGC